MTTVPIDGPAAVAFEAASFAPPRASRRDAPPHPLLHDLTLSVGATETVVLVGPSGAGKTTALKLVNRLLDPSAGVVRVGGRATTDWDRVTLRRRIGYVIQEVGLFPHLTVARNIALVPELLKWPQARIDDRVTEMLDLVDLPPGVYGTRLPHQLSGGERQRVGVARALAADPPLLLLDEPFGALDPVTRSELQGELKALLTRLGKAALFVSHDLREALALGDRVALLVKSRLVLVAEPRAFALSDHPAARALLATLNPVGGPGG